MVEGMLINQEEKIIKWNIEIEKLCGEQLDRIQVIL